ncbi:MAG TPA: MerR family transcriptional regulator [Burkholderiaceae bacterium]|nr:MerR family transcriptional regulator [Burkholderiaceae bacterium]
MLATTQPTEADAEPMSIADVARETGIQKDTLRVWERRYGFPTPLRDATGDRRYSLEQVNRLRQIKRLLDAGLRPGAVVALSAQGLDERLAGLSAGATEARQGAAGRRRSAGLQVDQAAVLSPAEVAQWLDWIRDGSVEALHQALGQQALKHGLVRTIDHVAAPVAAAVGEAWATGQLTVYQEHLFTECLQRFLQDAVAAADRQHPPPRRSPRVLMTTLPGEHHITGLLMAECMLALEGCERRSLGRDTPLSDVVQAAEHWQVDAVGLSVSALPVASTVWSGLRQLRAGLPPQVAIWVGGSSPHLARRQIPEGIRVLPTVQALGEHIRLWREKALH